MHTNTYVYSAQISTKVYHTMLCDHTSARIHAHTMGLSLISWKIYHLIKFKNIFVSKLGAGGGGNFNFSLFISFFFLSI